MRLRLLAASLGSVWMIVLGCKPTSESEAGAAKKVGEAPAEARSVAQIDDPEPPPAKLPERPVEVLEPAVGGYELLAEGAEPRRALRFSPTTGGVQTLRVTLAMRVSMTGVGIPMDQRLPPIEQIQRAEVAAVDGDRIEVRIATERFVVRGGPGQDPRAVEMMQAAMDRIRGLERAMVFDLRGEILAGELSVPADASPQLARTLATLGETFEQLLVRLPEPAVGVGARWRETTTVTSGGMALEHTTASELVGRAGDQITIETRTTQRPLSRTFTSPDIPGELELLELDSRGSGRIVYALGEVLPRSARTSIDTRFSIAVEADGQIRQLGTAISIELAVERIE